MKRATLNVIGIVLTFALWLSACKKIETEEQKQKTNTNFKTKASARATVLARGTDNEPVGVNTENVTNPIYRDMDFNGVPERIVLNWPGNSWLTVYKDGNDNKPLSIQYSANALSMAYWVGNFDEDDKEDVFIYYKEATHGPAKSKIIGFNTYGTALYTKKTYSFGYDIIPYIVPNKRFDEVRGFDPLILDLNVYSDISVAYIMYSSGTDIQSYSMGGNVNTVYFDDLDGDDKAEIVGLNVNPNNRPYSTYYFIKSPATGILYTGSIPPYRNILIDQLDQFPGNEICLIFNSVANPGSPDGVGIYNMNKGKYEFGNVAPYLIDLSSRGSDLDGLPGNDIGIRAVDRQFYPTGISAVVSNYNDVMHFTIYGQGSSGGIGRSKSKITGDIKVKRSALPTIFP